MRLGIIGLGAIAPFFLRAVEADPSLTLTAACDLDPAKLAPLDVETFTDYKDLLQSRLVDGVIVTLPNDLHAPVAIDALERGIAVCCEKPLTIDPLDADAMTAAARRGGAALFTAFHRRYNSNLLSLASALQSQDLTGVVARYHENIAEHTGGDRWYLDASRCGGGCLIDNGPNALDAVRLLVGDLTVVDATIGDVRSGTEFLAVLDLVSADGVPVRVELDWALPTGEVKDVEVSLRDGRVLRADMLGGYDGFKASLDHEYRGILTEFRAAAAAGPSYADAGAAMVRLVADAYRIARAKERRLRMTAKDAVSTRLVKLLFHARTDRGMTFSPWLTRCVPAGSIHELVTTTDRPSRPGDAVDRVGFLGFTEFAAGTVVERGDQVWVGQRKIGTVAGFDECHAPNHYNILIDTDRLLTAADLDLRPGDEIKFVPDC